MVEDYLEKYLNFMSKHNFYATASALFFAVFRSTSVKCTKKNNSDALLFKTFVSHSIFGCSSARPNCC